MRGSALSSLLAEIEQLHGELVYAGSAVAVDGVHDHHRASARNLAHFVALRSADRRALQQRLAEEGLSSLGRCEPHVLATVEAVRRVLRIIVDPAGPAATSEEAEFDRIGEQAEIGFTAGPEILAANARRLLGEPAPGRATRIMVTLPSEAADDPSIAESLVAAGMEISRVNCAHDDPVAWKAMAANVRAAGRLHDRPVRILMDLAGPKLRTGPMPAALAVIKLKPRRNHRGEIVDQVRALLIDETRGVDPASVPTDLPVVPVRFDRFDQLAAGDRLRLTDARNSDRMLRVASVEEHGVVVRGRKAIYLVEGIQLRGDTVMGRVGRLPSKPGLLLVREGDELDLSADAVTATPPVGARPARIGCTLPEAVAAGQPGHRVLFDDGKIAGVVTSAEDGVLRVRIESAGRAGSKLRAEKGINLPDTDIPVSALTAKDEEDLGTILELADLVALSFVRQPDDVTQLLEQLRARKAEHVGVVLKIETTQAFAHLPELVRAAMAHRDIGVMIARGDLAVEAGYERLAEVQEEILWLCEAAHVPAIWATEVLDGLAKTGRPSRSEITDAAMADRAECVMLNKGPYITEAVQALDDILRRMASHHAKKRPLLRELRSWSRPLED